MTGNMTWKVRKAVWRAQFNQWVHVQKKRLGVQGKFTGFSAKHVVIQLAVRLIKRLDPDFFPAVRREGYGNGKREAEKIHKEMAEKKKAALEQKRKKFNNRKGMRKNVIKDGGFSCHYCGKFGEMTVDHLIPLSRGGKNERSNMVSACHDCNQKKGELTHVEFLTP